MKSVLISIQPKWCELIASGKKTIEVRKTKPKLETPFKVYIYCTNTKPYLVWADVFRGNWVTEFTHLNGYSREEAERIWDVFNGKVIGEFVCDRIDYVRNYGDCVDIYDCIASCLSAKEIIEYATDKNGKFVYTYGWHISDLVIYDEPKELREFHKYRFDRAVPLKRPFQSWGYVYEADT